MIALDAALQRFDRMPTNAWIARKWRWVWLRLRAAAGGNWTPDAPEPEIAWTAIPGRIGHV